MIILCPPGKPQLAPRDDCPSELHDYPLPLNYNAAHEEAGWRLRHRWSNRRCPRCRLYGWAPPTWSGQGHA